MATVPSSDVTTVCWPAAEAMPHDATDEALGYMLSRVGAPNFPTPMGIFHRVDFERLAELLGAIKGRFLLSLNDRPEVRQIFRGFDMEAVQTTYSISGPARLPGRVGELLISRGLV